MCSGLTLSQRNLLIFCRIHSSGNPHLNFEQLRRERFSSNNRKHPSFLGGKKQAHKSFAVLLIQRCIGVALLLTYDFTKGQLISKGLFLNSPKKRTKNFCPSRLGQKLIFSSSFFGRIEDTKISFRD